MDLIERIVKNFTAFLKYSNLDVHFESGPKVLYLLKILYFSKIDFTIEI